MQPFAYTSAKCGLAKIIGLVHLLDEHARKATVCVHMCKVWVRQGLRPTPFTIRSKKKQPFAYTCAKSGWDKAGVPCQPLDHPKKEAAVCVHVCKVWVFNCPERTPPKAYKPEELEGRLGNIDFERQLASSTVRAAILKGNFSFEGRSNCSHLSPSEQSPLSGKPISLASVLPHALGRCRPRLPRQRLTGCFFLHFNEACAQHWSRARGPPLGCHVQARPILHGGTAANRARHRRSWAPWPCGRI